MSYKIRMRKKKEKFEKTEDDEDEINGQIESNGYTNGHNRTDGNRPTTSVAFGPDGGSLQILSVNSPFSHYFF